MSIPKSLKGLASGHVGAIELVQLCHYYPLKLHNFVLTGDFRFEMLAPEGTRDHFFCIIVWLEGEHDDALIVSNATAV